MQKFIGEKLENVLNVLNQKGIKYIIKDNNFSVNGDTTLVTNIVAKDDAVILTVGSFIFDVRNKINEQ
ncbi:MAG: hypothetical protein IJW25_00245 [Clostridia bacterium]|nr:hypothetical protein [Clostridia bacterium]